MDDTAADTNTLDLSGIPWPDHAPPWPVPLPPAPERREPEGPSSAAADLLRTARWHAGLSQAEAAARAKTSQQTLLRYESGRTQPTLPTLTRLLEACGMALNTALVPLVDFDDPAIRDLLSRPPLQRLPAPFPTALESVLPALAHAGIRALLADKAAARLYGAPVKVWDCEFWVDGETMRYEELEAVLTACGGRSFWQFARKNPDTGETVDGSFGRHWSLVAGAEIRFRAKEDFAGLRLRSYSVEAAGVPVPVLAPADLTRDWHERDRDRLLLQRALMQRRRTQERDLP